PSRQGARPLLPVRPRARPGGARLGLPAPAAARRLHARGHPPPLRPGPRPGTERRLSAVPPRPGPDRAAGRIFSLDVARGIAMIVVLGVHAPPVPATAWGHAFDQAWKRSGWASVDWFFAMSAYLIVGLLLAERRRAGSIDVT